MKTIGTLITQTPFRISFFGGGSDYPEIFNNHGGSVLGTTVDKYIYVTLNSLERLLEKKIRLSYSKLEIVDDPSELQHELVRGVLMRHKSMLDSSFMDIHSFADLPYSSGVGSSSAFLVGFLNAVYLINKIYKTPYEIAREAIEIERRDLNMNGGWQDQIHCAFGGFNRIDFSDNNFQVSPILAPRENFAALESSCMFFFTGLTRSSAEVQSKVGEQNKQKKEAEIADFAKAQVSMVNQAQKALTMGTPKDCIEVFGSLLNESWSLKKQLADAVSNPVLDEIYSTAMKNGTLGGKVLGAGGGGFFLFIVPMENQAKVAQALSKLHRINFRFENGGTRVLFAKQ